MEAEPTNHPRSEHDLPLEIWDKICEYLDDFLDVARFRLTCKTFASTGARAMLQNSIVYFQLDDFAHLRAIANDSAKSKHVRSLELDARDFILPRESPRENLYSELESQHAEFADIVHNNLDFALLHEVLPELTGLRRLILSSGDWTPRHQDFTPDGTKIGALYASRAPRPAATLARI
ncbi:hypothetical protein N0V88_007113 [Collariella sp. IMI 366227]|nr:hypothetical protein N0V88_007113 [Collariella sp. IMI 366227]